MRMRPQLDGGNGLVYCDWRWQVYGCIDESFFQTLYVITAIVGAINTFLISGILIFRLFYWQISLLHNWRVRGPEGLLFFLMCHSGGIMLHCAVALTAGGPRIFLEITSSVSVTTCLVGIGLYLYSFILATPPNMFRIAQKHNVHMPRRRVISSAVTIGCIEVIVVQVILAVLVGAISEHGDETVIYMVALNVHAVHWIVFEIVFIVFAVNFLRVLDHNLENLKSYETASSKKLEILTMTVSKIKSIARGICYGCIFPLCLFIMANCYYMYSVQSWSRAIAILYLLSPMLIVMVLVILAIGVDIQKVRLGVHEEEHHEHPLTHFASSDHKSGSMAVGPNNVKEYIRSSRESMTETGLMISPTDPDIIMNSFLAGTVRLHPIYEEP